MTSEVVSIAPSPFVPGTNIQFAVDSTSLSAASKCLKYYKLSIVDGWRKKNESVHLRFGGEFASALEFYHKAKTADKLSHDEALDLTIEKTLIAIANWSSDHPKKNEVSLLRTIIWYLDHYENDPAEVLILEDGTPAVELSFKVELPWEAAPGIPYLLCGHLDKVVTYCGDTFVADQKTTSGNLGAFYFAEFNPHTQMSCYTYSSKIILGTNVSGVMIDAVKILTHTSEFARGFTMRTEAQLVEWVEDTRKWTEIIKFSAERDYWPMNPSSCNNYGGCAFREICSQDPTVRQNYLETSFEKKPWNPLTPR